jgi:hypothetical protein
MATGRGDRRASEVVEELFGAPLQQQGRGFYVTLELLAIVRGVQDAGEHAVLDPVAEPIRYVRRSHDFARRVATGAEIEPLELHKAVQGQTTLHTLNALFSSLLVTIPGRRREPSWFGAHLYPFVGELIHYDAAQRKQDGKMMPAVERYTFRDGGGLAYKILRSDPDTARRESVRDGLVALVSDSGTALGRVTAALRAHDHAPTDVFTDESEARAKPYDDLSPWADWLRAGVDRIVRRSGSPAAKRIENLMHWVPYCIARHQLSLARHELGLPREAIPVDFTSDSNPLRSESQLTLDKCRWDIVAGLTSLAARKMKEAPEIEREVWSRYTQHHASFTSSPRSFFSETLAAVGALNATGGRRHFTLKPPMLEALVAATLEPGEEMEFQDFCNELSVRYAIYADPISAQSAELTLDIDTGVFDANARALRGQLTAIGLLTHYSDATSLVHGETV